MTAEALVDRLNLIRREAERLTGRLIWASSFPQGGKGWKGVFRCESGVGHGCGRKWQWIGEGDTVVAAAEDTLRRMQTEFGSGRMAWD